MNRRRAAATLVLGLLLGLLDPPSTATAQTRIGWLSAGRAGSGGFFDDFRRGLRELAWVEGQNLVIEGREAGDRPERLPDLAGELVAVKADVIVTAGGPATAAAHRNVTSVPVVSVTGDPVAPGFVASLARPGGNITGLAILSTRGSRSRSRSSSARIT